MSTTFELINKNQKQIYDDEYRKIKYFIKRVEQGLQQHKIEYDKFTLFSFKRGLVDELDSPETIEIAYRGGDGEGGILYELKQTKEFIAEKYKTGNYIIEGTNYQQCTLEQFFNMVDNKTME